MSERQERIALYLSREHACSYLPDKMTRSIVVDPYLRLDSGRYGALLESGFRRSGGQVYRPHCRSCNACVACRVPISQFRPNRSQKRCQSGNRDLVINSAPAALGEEHYALYRRYQEVRHPGGEMSRSSAAELEDFLVTDWCRSEFIEFRLQGKLVGVAVTDTLPDALSSVYTFFDPDLARRALGVFSVLSQIGLAVERRLEWLYLGYWIRDSRKMRYKTAYRPIELRQQGTWRRFDRGQGIEM